MIDRVKKETEMMRRHMKVLDIVNKNGPAGIVKLSDKTGFPRHKVRYSLKVLEQEGLIEPTNRGARATESAKNFRRNLADDVDELIKTLEEFKSE